MRRRLALSFLCLAGFLFCSREAYLSQIHYRGISLEQLVERSQLILIVKAASPAQKQINVAIGKDQKNREAPAFVRVLSRCEVQGAITPAGAELVGKTIEIDGAHWQQSLSMHRSYYLQGLSKSPIWERYNPEPPPGPAPAASSAHEPADAPFIVFLRRDGKDGFAFVVDGARERLGSRAAIEELLRARK
jgi:hypothetical protein